MLTSTVIGLDVDVACVLIFAACIFYTAIVSSCYLYFSPRPLRSISIKVVLVFVVVLVTNDKIRAISHLMHEKKYR